MRSEGLGSMSTQVPGSNAFLAGLNREDFSLLRSHLSQKELRAGASLHRYGESIDDVFFPHSGVVTMTLPLQEGRGIGVTFVGSEGVVGGFAAAASAPASSDSEVLLGGQATRVSTSAFRYALDRSPTLRHRAAQFDNTLIAETQRTALCNAAHSVEARICRCLLEVQDRMGGDRISLTQDTLARLLGVRRTTVTLVAGRLEAAGALNCRRGFMQIVDRTVIEAHCCECHAHAKDYAARLHPVQNDGVSPRVIVASRST
jgi:CRP-like cAMP-binding protein